MELHIPSIFVLLSFFLILFMVMYQREKKRCTSQKQITALPPGPWKLPLIGNLHNMVGLPHHTLRDLAKKHGSLMHLQLGEVSAVVVSSPKVAEQIMKIHDLAFANRPEILAFKVVFYDCTDVSYALYGNYWREMRKILMLELLSAKRVQSFQSIREEEVSNLIKDVFLMAGSPINLSNRIFSLTNDVTSRTAFGKKTKEKEAFMSSMQEVMNLAGGFGMADLFPSLKFLHVISGMKPKLEMAHHKVDKILDGIIKDHRENRKATKSSNNGEMEEDIVDVLIRLQESGAQEFSFTDNNLKAVILDIFTAGSETSSNTVEWAMSELLRNPGVMKKLQAEVRKVFNKKETIDWTEVQNIDYLKLVIKETLRLHPPLPLLIPRECRESCEIEGYEIPIKTKVIVNAWAIGRDPEYWNNADRFDPERFHGNSIDYKGTKFEYIPFGAGRRMCPGVSFGIANVDLLLAQILYYFDWKLPKGMKPEDLDMSEEFGMTVRRKKHLYLIPFPYHT